MGGLSRKNLLKKIDVGRIREAIEAAEKQTSGEIRVSVAPYFWGSVRRVAEKAFHRLGITGTKDRNGILFFIVPSRGRFVVLGDEGIHAKVGQEFWDELTEAMSGHFRKGEFTEGLTAGIGEAGFRLAEHFPYDAAADHNELPDDIDVVSGERKRE